MIVFASIAPTGEPDDERGVSLGTVTSTAGGGDIVNVVRPAHCKRIDMVHRQPSPRIAIRADPERLTENHPPLRRRDAVAGSIHRPCAALRCGGDAFFGVASIPLSTLRPNMVAVCRSIRGILRTHLCRVRSPISRPPSSNPLCVFPTPPSALGGENGWVVRAIQSILLPDHRDVGRSVGRHLSCNALLASSSESVGGVYAPAECAARLRVATSAATLRFCLSHSTAPQSPERVRAAPSVLALDRPVPIYKNAHEPASERGIC